MVEFKHHVPIIKNTIQKLNEKFPNLKFCIVALPCLRETLEKEFFGFENVFFAKEEEKWEEISKSVFVIGKSGTNIMEIALLGVPSIVYYKVGFLTAMIIKAMIYNQMGTLLNITAGRFVLPEFIQENAKNIHTKAIEWLENPQELEKVRQEMKKELEKFASRRKPEEVILENL
jgi:lipid-A-disaccharide synthase